MNAVIGATVSFIAYSEIPIDTSLCDGPVISPSSAGATSTPSSSSIAAGTPMPSESPTGAGDSIIATFLIIVQCVEPLRR